MRVEGVRGRIFQNPYRDKDGTWRRASVWYIGYSVDGREHRERGGTQAEAVALLRKRQAGRPGDKRFVPRPGHRVDRRTFTSRAADGSRRGNRDRLHHGLTTLKRVITSHARSLDEVLDPSSPIGRALATWRGDLVRRPGRGGTRLDGPNGAIVELALRTRLMLDSADAFILSLPRIVNGRTRAVYPVVLQRQSLARDLAHFLGLLGLERRKPKAIDLSEYLAQRYQAPGPEASAPSGEGR